MTALQSTVLSKIRRSRGAAVAHEYARRSAEAVEQVAAVAAAEGIDCALRRRAAYTVAVSGGELGSVEEEARIAQDAGLPVVMTDEVDLPFAVAGAARLDGQVELHPVRYAHGLAAAIDGGGSAVFENTRATGLHEGRPVRIDTTQGPR